jgi:hypothetical protein
MAVIESGLKARLEGYTALTALLADGTDSIWAELAPQNADKPYLTYSIHDDIARNVMGKETTPTEALFQVSFFADEYDDLLLIFIQVRACLNRYSGTEGSVTVQDTFYDGRNSQYDESDRDYQMNVDFRIFYEE